MDRPTEPWDEVKSHGSGNATDIGYKVEVRTSYHSPTVIGQGDDALVIDTFWRQLHIREGSTPFGVNIPVRRSWGRSILDHGLLTYVAAEAHRWAFLAYLEATQTAGTLCIETRLVEVECKTSYALTEKGVTEPLGRVVAPKSTPRLGEKARP